MGPRALYFGKFGPEFKKTMVIFGISTLKFVKYGFLTHTGKFGIGSAFSKGPGSTFSKSPGPGLGPLYKGFGLLYKVCLLPSGRIFVKFELKQIFMFIIRLAS